MFTARKNCAPIIEFQMKGPKCLPYGMGYLSAILPKEDTFCRGLTGHGINRV